MNETANLIIGWAFPTVNIVLLVLVATRTGLRGKAWLIGHLVAGLVVTILWRAPQLLTKFGLMGSSAESNFYSRFGLPLSLATLAGYCLLIPYIVVAAAGPLGAGTPLDPSSVRTAPMTFSEALFSFRGRMSCSDYWLKGFLPLLPLGIFSNVLVYAVNDDGARIAGGLIALVSLWPSLALLIKRLHDRNHSGWLALTMLIPIAGIVFGFWLTFEVWFLAGTTGPNRFGNDPLARVPAGGTLHGSPATPSGNPNLAEGPPALG